MLIFIQLAESNDINKEKKDRPTNITKSVMFDISITQTQNILCKQLPVLNLFSGFDGFIVAGDFFIIFVHMQLNHSELQNNNLQSKKCNFFLNISCSGCKEATHS